MRILTFSSPPFTLSTAHMLAVTFALTYVGSIYFSKAARLSFSSPSHQASKPQRDTNGWPNEREKGSNERWRDDPDVIRARLIAVSSATLVSCLFFFGLVWSVVRPSEYVSSKSAFFPIISVL
jgi:prenyl protein peptidase